MQVMGERNAIRNLYADSGNISSVLGNANLGADITSLQSQINGADSLTDNTILTDDDFGKILFLDTVGAGGDFTVDLPDPTGLADGILTLASLQNGTDPVTVTTPAGSIGSLGSSITLYPNQSIKIQTSGVLGYQIISFSNGPQINHRINSLQTLGSSPEQILPAPGANKMWLFQGGTVRMNYGTVQYTGGASLQLRLGTSAILAIGNASAFQGNATVIFAGLNPTSNTSSIALGNVVNQAMNIGTVGGANFGAGDSTVDLFLKFSVLNVP